MPQPSFIDPEWKSHFDQAGYSHFDDWWSAEKNLVESGNFRGPDADSSWSHVSRIALPCGRIVYLKRQQNHYPNNTLLKLLRTPTFEIEWKNYQAYKKAGVPTLNIVYFASRKHNGNRQCIIVSEELQGMTPIYDLMKSFDQHGWPKQAQRFAILGAVVKVIRRLHDAGMIHNALYDRHIYLNIPIEDGRAVIPEHIQACLIDLERTKFPGKDSAKLISHDLEKMFRRIQWPARDCLWFLKKYLGIQRLTPEAKSIARKIAVTRKAR